MIALARRTGASPVSVSVKDQPGACPVVARPALARQRAALARAALAECRFCAHDCGVNRLAGETGLCHAGAQARVFTAQIEVGDESELIPTFAIAVSGCDLRCEFCVTRAESWNPRAGRAASPREVANRSRLALAGDARTVMILGGEPTIHLPFVLEIVSFLPASAKLIWKTNAHGSKQARDLLDGIFDVWLADYKFGNDTCARFLAGVQGYSRVVRENLFWARQHSELIVRHLLMPGHVDCCWEPVARWLATELPEVKVSLRDAFWPAPRASHGELRRAVTADERHRAFGLAQELNLNLVA